MTTGIESAGVDLDTIFEPRVGTKVGDVGIKSNGSVDISNRFEDIASGTGPSATGIKDGGTDLNLIFAEEGSLSPPVITVSGEVITHNVTNGNTARAAVRVNINGQMNKVVGTITSQIDASTDWRIPNANGAGFWVQFTKNLFADTPNYDPNSTTLGTWYELDSVTRAIGYEVSADDTELTGTIIVKISDDSSGSPVLDTGNYFCTAKVGNPI